MTNATSLAKARIRAAEVHRANREARLKIATDKAAELAGQTDDIRIRKLLVGAFYLAEGSKGRRGGLTFGNSDSGIIRLFLYLLRSSWVIDETKFRCTLQARAGQELQKLERFWANVTQIPISQFYLARVDARTIGKPTRKPEYKGVCRIDYFSTELLNEVLAIGTMLTKGP